VSEGSIYFFFLMWEKIAVYLLSPLAQFGTGFSLTIDGGMDMRG
jgi:low affinity Fe/Cu permease